MRELLENKYAELFETYRFEKPIKARNINMIIKKSLQSFMKECKKPAIYCNGGHTKMLMADFIYELKNVRYIVDNYAAAPDEGGFCMIKDEELESTGIDGVIISSFKFKDNIVEGLQKNHPGIKYLNIYEKFAENGINLQADYYYHNHPYQHYHTINTLQRKLKESISIEEKEKLYHQLIAKYVQIKDFRTAIICTQNLCVLRNAKEYENLKQDLEELYELEKKTAEDISDKNVLLLCLDGLRYQDVSKRYMPGFVEEFCEKAYIFEKAYSFSTSTFESLIPVYSENGDLRTKYYCNNMVPAEKCRFIREAERQGREIHFYTDMESYIYSENIKYSNTCQTITEKIWNFILDAVETENGLFYMHELYESHFSFSNPYTQDKLISEGTAILFDFLPVKGGKLRTDYKQQHLDAIRYLDDILPPLVGGLNCRMLVYADHGNLILDKLCDIQDVPESKFTCAEEWIRIPYMIKAPEMKSGTNKQLISLMSLNEIVVSLLNQKTYEAQDNQFVKVARSELYNPDFRYLYKKYGREHCLLAFEAFIFTEGYKLVIYEDGKAELYKTDDDEKCNNDQLINELYRRIKNYITVCRVEEER